MTLLVLGLGNDLLGDDGIGLLAAASLEGHLGSRVEIARSGRSGLYLVEELEGYDAAIILASVLGEQPGRVGELPAAALRPLGPSAHYAGLPEALALARSAGLRVPGRLRSFAVALVVGQTSGCAPRGPPWHSIGARAESTVTCAGSRAPSGRDRKRRTRTTCRLYALGARSRLRSWRGGTWPSEKSSSCSVHREVPHAPTMAHGRIGHDMTPVASIWRGEPKGGGGTPQD